MRISVDSDIKAFTSKLNGKCFRSYLMSQLLIMWRRVIFTRLYICKRYFDWICQRKISIKNFFKYW